MFFSKLKPSLYRVLWDGLALLFGIGIIPLIVLVFPAGIVTSYSVWTKLFLIGSLVVFIATLLSLWRAKTERSGAIVIASSWILLGIVGIPYYVVNFKSLQHADWIWLTETIIQMLIGLVAIVLVVRKWSELNNPATASKLEFGLFLVIGGTVFNELIEWIAAPTWAEFWYLLIACIIIALTFIGTAIAKDKNKPKLQSAIWPAAWTAIGFITLLFLKGLQTLLIYNWAPWLIMISGVVCLGIVFIPQRKKKQEAGPVEAEGYTRTQRPLSHGEKRLPDHQPCRTTEEVNNKFAEYIAENENGYNNAKDRIQRDHEWATLASPWKPSVELWIEGSLYKEFPEELKETDDKVNQLMQGLTSGSIKHTFRFYQPPQFFGMYRRPEDRN